MALQETIDEEEERERLMAAEDATDEVLWAYPILYIGAYPIPKRPAPFRSLL